MPRGSGVDGEVFATIERALDERTIGHNPERLNLMKVYQQLIGVAACLTHLNEFSVTMTVSRLQYALGVQRTKDTTPIKQPLVVSKL